MGLGDLNSNAAGSQSGDGFESGAYYRWYEYIPGTISSTGKNIPNTSFKIFPNPANNHVKVELKENKSNHIKIYDQLGKIVFEKVISQSVTTIKTSHFSKGIYFIKVHSGNDQISTKKLFIQ